MSLNKKLAAIITVSTLCSMTACHKTPDIPTPDNVAKTAEETVAEPEIPDQKAVNPNTDKDIQTAKNTESDSDSDRIDSKRDIVPSKFEKADETWSNIKIKFNNCADELEDQDKARIEKELSGILQKWNTLRNQKNVAKLVKLYGESAVIRGSSLPNSKIGDNLNKSFTKHKDFSQTPGSEVTIDLLSNSMEESLQNWSVRFPETFSQDGKTTDTEIFMVLSRSIRDDEGSDWAIIVESDIATDRNMRKKLGLYAYDKITGCGDLLYTILIDSPIMRYKINTYYEDALRDMKSGFLQKLELKFDETWEDSNILKNPEVCFVLREIHSNEADPNDIDMPPTYTVTTARFSIDTETKLIKDDIFENTFPIETQYHADLKRLCKIK